VAQSGAFWVHFEHLCTSGNGVGNREITMRDSSAAITPLSDGAALHILPFLIAEGAHIPVT
jgi:hypothetical protein